MSEVDSTVGTSERVYRYITNDLSIRASVVNATEVVKKMQELQKTMPLPTVAVGRTMVGALLMASQLKEGQEVGILIKALGPMGNVFAQANFNGQVRGYTPHTLYEPAVYPEKLKLKDAIGTGYMTVVRHQPFQRQPYQGTTQLAGSEIGDDIAYYLHQSQQIRSIISLGVYLDVYGRVRSAGGVLIEVMPGVEEKVVEVLENNYKAHHENVSELILRGTSSPNLIAPLLTGFEYTELPHPYPIAYSCPCNVERVKSAMFMLGLADLDDMIQKKEAAEVHCQMCGRNYEIGVAELIETRNTLFKTTLH